MNSNLITAVVFIMLAIGGVLATKALAFRGEDHGWKRACTEENGAGPHQERFEKMAEVLGLTSQQREQIAAILTSSRDSTKELRGKLRDNRDALRAASAPEGFDEAKIRTLAAEGGSLKAEMMVTRAKTRQQIHGLLTPEQQQLMEKIQPLLGDKPGHRGQHRRFEHFEPAES